MQRNNFFLSAAAAAVLVFGLDAAAGAQTITPATVDATIDVGETITINKTITLTAGGATKVDLFFLSDVTGSMAGTIGAAQAGATAIMNALPDGYQFGVGAYGGDPAEGVSLSTAYSENQALTTDKTAAQIGINAWSAGGGGDTPEGNLYALQQVANTAAWRADAQRLIVWFGDASGHTETTTLDESITALGDVNAKVIAFNNTSAGSGIDGTYGSDTRHQASTIVGDVGGAVVNNFLSVPDSLFAATVLDQITTATSSFDLVFGSSLVGTGLNLAFTCTDMLGCDDVAAGDSRTFDLSITGVTPGDYTFNVFAQGVDAIESDHIRVLGGTSTIPEPVSMVLLGTGLAGIGAVKRRRRRSRELA